MNISEFRHMLKDNEDDAISMINKHLLEVKGTKDFKQGDFEFSYSAIVDELKEKNYIYSGKLKQFIKSVSDEQEENVNDDPEFLDQKILHKLNKKKMKREIQVTIRLNKELVAKIDELIGANKDYTRNQFIGDIVESGVERIIKIKQQEEKQNGNY